MSSGCHLVSQSTTSSDLGRFVELRAGVAKMEAEGTAVHLGHV
jgi:hypothetical protein